MCAILGSFSPEAFPASDHLREALLVMQHRGPDDGGLVTFTERGVAHVARRSQLTTNAQSIHGFLGHNRLAIIDLSENGHQPMAYTVRGVTYWIVFNGEIYNYIELKRELGSHGFKFQTESDTEVLLACYLQWGKDCLHRLNGMFAFAIYEPRSRSLFVARDRVGKKPLYYTLQPNGGISFASEIKALHFLDPAKTYELDRAQARLYLEFGWNFCSPAQSFYDGIQILPGGHFLEWKDGRSQITEWWQPAPNPTFEALSKNQAKEQILELFQDAVRVRLRSDVPVGVCLSGGLDSSGIIWGINQLLKQDPSDQPIHVFTAVRPTGEDSEQIHAEQTVKALKNERIVQHILPIEHIPFETVREFCYFHDEPIRNASVLNQYLVFQAVQKQNIRVLLNGQGADELFWGYAHHFQRFALDDVQHGRIGHLLSLLPVLRERSGQSTLKSLLNIGRIPFSGRQIQRTHAKNTPWMQSASFDAQAVGQLYRYQQPLELHAFQNAELRHMRLPILLRDEDRNSMRFSIETRLPYLDYRLIELAISLSDLTRTELSHGYTKPLLRETFASTELPKEVVWQKIKRGFYDPVYTRIKDYEKNTLEMIRASDKISEFIRPTETITHIQKTKDHDLLWRIFNLSLLLEQDASFDFHASRIHTTPA